MNHEAMPGPPIGWLSYTEPAKNVTYCCTITSESQLETNIEITRKTCILKNPCKEIVVSFNYDILGRRRNRD